VESKNIAFEVFGFPGFLELGKPRKPLKTWKLICQITDVFDYKTPPHFPEELMAYQILSVLTLRITKKLSIYL